MSKKAKLIIAGIGNVIDIVATLILINYFGLVEVNPLMGWLLQWPWIAVATKLIAINGILLFLNFTKRKKYTDGLATFAAIMYGGLGTYYLLFFISYFIYQI